MRKEGSSPKKETTRAPRATGAKKSGMTGKAGAKKTADAKKVPNARGVGARKNVKKADDKKAGLKKHFSIGVYPERKRSGYLYLFSPYVIYAGLSVVFTKISHG